MIRPLIQASITATLILLPTASYLAQAEDDSEMSSDMEKEREEQLAKKLSRSELSDAKEQYDDDMDHYRELTSILKKIRQDEDVAEGRDALKRLMPPSTETYDRMVNPYGQDESSDDEEGEEDDSDLTVEEIRAKRAYDQIKSMKQKEYDRVITDLQEEITRILDSDLESYELMQMLERLEDEL